MWCVWYLCGWDMYSKFISYHQCNVMPCVLYSLWVVMGSLDQIKKLIIVDDVMPLNVFMSEFIGHLPLPLKVIMCIYS